MSDKTTSEYRRLANPAPADRYWDTLSEEQKESFRANTARFEDLHGEIPIIDELDIWNMIIPDLRGPKPSIEIVD